MCFLIITFRKEVVRLFLFVLFLFFLVGLLGEDLRWVFAQLRNYEVND